MELVDGSMDAPPDCGVIAVSMAAATACEAAFCARLANVDAFDAKLEANWVVLVLKSNW